MSATAFVCNPNPHQVDEIPAGEERPVRYTVQLEDHGQDFLEWDLDDRGNIVDCRPFQAWVWIKYQVVNQLRDLRAGDTLWTVPRDRSGVSPFPLNYPVKRVREVLS